MTQRAPSYDELRVITRAVARLRARIAALAGGMMGGTLLAVATAWLVIRGGVDVGAHLGLLRHYFPGYRVTLWGVLVGFLYGAASGALVGWSFASIYNLVRDRRLRPKG